MTHSVKVDKAKCIGCGSCEAICPASFLMKDGKASAKNSSVEKLTCEEEAKEACPVGAILVVKS